MTTYYKYYTIHIFRSYASTSIFIYYHTGHNSDLIPQIFLLLLADWYAVLHLRVNNRHFLIALLNMSLLSPRRGINIAGKQGVQCTRAQRIHSRQVLGKHCRHYITTVTASEV